MRDEREELLAFWVLGDAVDKSRFFPPFVIGETTAMADWEQQQKQWPTFVIAFSKIGKRFAGIPATTIQQGAMRGTGGTGAKR